jgi:hypothetical protein
MYADYFNRIIFCGINVIEKIRSIKDDDMRIYLSGIDMNLFGGYFHYDCLTKAIQMRLNTRRILLMSDDVLIKPWNMRNLSVDKIWFIKPIFGLQLINVTKHNTPKHITPWPWWPWASAYGQAAAFKTFSTLKKEENKNSLIDNFFHIYSDSTGSDFAKNEIYVQGTGSDMWYLPNKFFNSFQLIAGICRESNLFLEIAAPVVLYGLDSQNNTEQISITYQWNVPHGGSFIERYHPADMAYHSVKISMLKNERDRRDFCELFVKDKTSPILNDFRVIH